MLNRYKKSKLKISNCKKKWHKKKKRGKKKKEVKKKIK
jgi:hypothetical protein